MVAEGVQIAQKSTTFLIRFATSSTIPLQKVPTRSMEVICSGHGCFACGMLPGDPGWTPHTAKFCPNKTSTTVTAVQLLEDTEPVED